jgi:photosystem II stability/assembly factor-like uncharacterized protein
MVFVITLRCSIGVTMKKITRLVSSSIILSLAFAVESWATDTVNSALYEGLKWREIGPWRGGRVTAVTGVPGDDRMYYMGATGGGVWKTGNAGISWQNISDEYFGVGTIGAIAVADSDVNVIYVGTGEAPIRGVTTSHGDGMYKSMDAGATWEHIGLSDAGQIARIIVHPRDPDLVYVAVQGQIWGPSEERGVYRSKDGGATWEAVLQVDNETGATDLSMDPTNPRIMYASMWEHGRTPWFIKSGGTAGGLFKTTDGGDTWEKLTGGLPELIGKTGIDVSASSPNRIYAIVEAELDKGGLWRSDDYGKTWSLLNNDRILWSRAWYYIHIKADPQNSDTVWVLNAPIMKSIDGGKTFEKKSTPHGDHHDQWFNPENSLNFINANDGGATITFDGGESWSSIYNQPTAQFYRVSTDNLVPYRLYGGQQDNSTVAIASRTFDGGIGHDDYFPVGGGESAHIAFDPDNPRLIYATTINGTLTEYDHENKRLRPIKPYPEYVFGQQSKDLKYRTNWNAPVASSPHDHSILYYGTQILLKSTDRGVTWTEISPDLTKNDVTKQGLNGGPLTPENVGAEFYGTIFYVVESVHEAGVIWVGTDDGLLQVTRNGGRSWEDVTPEDLGGAQVNSIEVSQHDTGTVYIAVSGYKMNDFRPHIYRVSDYGDRWDKIDDDLPQDNFVRVVREDPERQGLLYAGAESGMFVSFDDGDNWQSLDMNLPPVPITDLKIRQDNLIAATQGRGYWILDDLTVVRQSMEVLADEVVHLFRPKPTVLMRTGGRRGANEGANPPSGAVLSYYIADEVEGPLSIEIHDSDGNLVRDYSSEERDFERCIIGNMDQRIPFEVRYPAHEEGLNQWGWDFRFNGLHCIDDVKLFAGFGGTTVTPGTYRVTVAVGGNSSSADLVILSDPRVDATDADYEFLSERRSDVTIMLNDLLVNLAIARRARAQVADLLAEYPDAADLAAAGESAVARLTEWEDKVTQTQYGTYEDEDSMPPMLDVHIRHVLDVIDRAGAPVSEGSLERLSDLGFEWDDRKQELRDIASTDLAMLNDWAIDNGVLHITQPIE